MPGVSSNIRWMLVVPHFASPTTKTLGKGPALGIVGHPLPLDGVMAEREGFEPSRRFPAYTLSRRAPSTTRPPLRREPETMGSRAGQVPVRALTRAHRPGPLRRALPASCEQARIRSARAGVTPSPCRRRVRVRPLSRVSSVTPGRSGAGAGRGRSAARGARASAASSASGVSGSAAARAAAMRSRLAGPQALDEGEAEALGEVGGEAQARRRGRGRSRGRRGCASASGGWRWRRARAARRPRWGRRRGRWRARRRGRARSG